MVVPPQTIATIASAASALRSGAKDMGSGLLGSAGIGAKKASGILNDVITNPSDAIFGKGKSILGWTGRTLKQWLKLIFGIFVIFLIVLGVWAYWPRVSVFLQKNLGVKSGGDAYNKIQQGVTTGINESEQEAAKQRALATGDMYESDINENADEDLGVFLEDIEFSQEAYKVDDPLTVWAAIKVKTINDNGTTLNVSCYLKDSNNEGTKIYGKITPKDSFRVFDEDVFDVKCEVPAGKLKEETNEFFFDASFDFTTKSMLKASFMDADALRNIKNNPDLLDDVDLSPIAKSTPGPVSIGIASRKYPISVGNQEIQPSLDASINNAWNGNIKKINSLEMVVPSAIKITGCDSAKNMKLIESDNRNLAFYQLEQTGINNMNGQIENVANNGDASFLLLSIKCLMDIDKGKILSGSILAKPVERTIFVNSEYTYELSESAYIVTIENTGFIVRLIADGDYSNKINIGHQLECEGEFYNGDILSATYEMTLIRNDAEIKSSQKLNAVCQKSVCSTGVLNYNTIFGEGMIPQRGDTLRCIMEMTPKEGTKKWTGSRYATIVNADPRITKVYFEPEYPTVGNSVKCVAEVEDIEKDPVTASFRLKVNNFELSNGQAECSSGTAGKYICKSPSLPASQLAEDDNVFCEMIANDGLSSSDTGYEDIEISSS